MKRTVCTLLFALGVSVVILALAHPGRATLGERVTSVESDRKMLAARQGTITNYTGYSVHEMSDNTTTVREYISPDGIVFAVAWNGYMHPDLPQILGTYYPEFQSANEQTPRKYGVKHREVKAANVVVQSWGHMRDLHGRAYAPDLIPQGVSIDDIQ